MTQEQIAEKLYESVRRLGNSSDKKRAFIKLPSIILKLAKEIESMTYRPNRFRVFIVTDPKVREIFAPDFRDRLVQQWLIGMVEPTIDKQFIDDSFANRKGKGTLAAIKRVQHFMRKKQNTHYCQLDIRSFFPTIDRCILLSLWKKQLHRLPYDEMTLQQIDAVATTIITQSPTKPAPLMSGRRDLLSSIPSHKSLFHAKEGIGLPIGSLSSQFFSNLYLNELDQYVKHTLKINSYVRYVDDMMLLDNDVQLLMEQKNKINDFLRVNLGLSLHPNKVVLQRVKQGANFLGAIVFPHHTYVRRRQIKSLKARIDFFDSLLHPVNSSFRNAPTGGSWGKCVSTGECVDLPVQTKQQKILATINSYFGLFVQSHSFKLRYKLFVNNTFLNDSLLPSNADITHFCCFKS